MPRAFARTTAAATHSTPRRPHRTACSGAQDTKAQTFCSGRTSPKATGQSTHIGPSSLREQKRAPASQHPARASSSRETPSLDTALMTAWSNRWQVKATDFVASTIASTHLGYLRRHSRRCRITRRISREQFPEMNCTPNPKVQAQRLIARFAGEASSSLRLEHGADWSTDNKLWVRDVTTDWSRADVWQNNRCPSNHTSPIPLRGNAPLPSERRIYWQAVGHEHTTNAARQTEAQLAWACVDLSENLKMKKIDVKSQGRSRLRVQRRCMHA
jgi:hypothetical protein